MYQEMLHTILKRHPQSLHRPLRLDGRRIVQRSGHFRPPDTRQSQSRKLLASPQDANVMAASAQAVKHTTFSFQPPVCPKKNQHSGAQSPQSTDSKNEGQTKS